MLLGGALGPPPQLSLPGPRHGWDCLHRLPWGILPEGSKQMLRSLKGNLLFQKLSPLAPGGFLPAWQ